MPAVVVCHRTRGAPKCQFLPTASAKHPFCWALLAAKQAVTKPPKLPRNGGRLCAAGAPSSGNLSNRPIGTQIFGERAADHRTSTPPSFVTQDLLLFLSGHDRAVNPTNRLDKNRTLFSDLLSRSSRDNSSLFAPTVPPSVRRQTTASLSLPSDSPLAPQQVLTDSGTSSISPLCLAIGIQPQHSALFRTPPLDLCAAPISVHRHGVRCAWHKPHVETATI